MSLKGQTLLHEKLTKLGFNNEQISALLPMMRDWAINDIIQIDEHTTMMGEPYDTINKMYEVASFYKSQMRDRVKSQTKESTHLSPTPDHD